MKRIRAGFMLGAMGHGWIGGVIYFRNLFHSLAEYPERSIDPAIIVGRKSDLKMFADFPTPEIIQTPVLDRLHPAWVLRRLLEKTFKRDLVYDQMLRRNRIGFQSHLFTIRSRSRIASAAWIPDFQHVRLPQFFTEAELSHRDAGFRSCCNLCDAVILSSEDAQGILRSFAPQAIQKSHVLHFVARPPEAGNIPSLDDLSKKYDFKPPFFHLPNQFWAHKNHLAVVDALSVLRKKGIDATVIATGQTKDPRQPDHFGRINARIKELNLEANFRILGLVPYPEVIGLMKNSIALINPSFFEGWSTTVEESKSIGKRIILSDIPVHREQAPVSAIYFDPNDPNKIAEAMQAILDDRNFDATGMRLKAEQDFRGRFLDFGKQYCSLVEKILGDAKSGATTGR